MTEFEQLNLGLQDLLLRLGEDPIRTGEVVQDPEYDAQGLRVHDALLKRAAEFVRVSDQLRKNMETEKKLELLSGQYIHEKQFDSLVDQIYAIVETSILKYSEPSEQLREIRSGFQALTKS